VTAWIKVTKKSIHSKSDRLIAFHATCEIPMDLMLLVTQLVIIGLYLSRFSIARYIPPPIRGFYNRVFTDMKFKIGIWWQTIVIPIMISLIFLMGWILFHLTIVSVQATNPIPDNIFYYFLNSGILAPISEEIIQCFVLSFAFIIFFNLGKSLKILMNLVALTLISLLIALYHFNPTSINFSLRFLQFMVYGAVYYLYDRNLFPAIITHSSWNLSLLLLNIQL